VRFSAFCRLFPPKSVNKSASNRQVCNCRHRSLIFEPGYIREYFTFHPAFTPRIFVRLAEYPLSGCFRVATHHSMRFPVAFRWASSTVMHSRSLYLALSFSRVPCCRISASVCLFPGGFYYDAGFRGWFCTRYNAAGSRLCCQIRGCKERLFHSLLHTDLSRRSGCPWVRKLNVTNVLKRII
jgi:hypothetical protein